MRKPFIDSDDPERFVVDRSNGGKGVGPARLLRTGPITGSTGLFLQLRLRGYFLSSRRRRPNSMNANPVMANAPAEAADTFGLVRVPV